MGIRTEAFGVTKNGEKVTKYILENENGMRVDFLDFGAVIQALYVPDKHGKIDDVVLGFEDIRGYEGNGSGLGAFIGRHANRIAGANVTIAGKDYPLAANDRGNNLHGGDPGFHRVMYEAETFEEEGSQSVEFSRLSPDMEQGFPGNLDVTVTYTLTPENELLIEYLAVSDRDTVVNLTNHSYFNLSGHDSGLATGHQVMICAKQFTPTDDAMIPVDIADVAGTPMDFTAMKKVEQDIHADYKPLLQGGGYDHNYVLEGSGEEIEKAAEVYDEKSGRVMEVFTNLPGLQFYSANFLDEPNYGKGGKKYGKREGLCFETQHFPNACKDSRFQSSILKAGQEYDYATIYKFSVRK